MTVPRTYTAMLLGLVVAAGCRPPSDELPDPDPPHISLYGVKLQHYRGTRVIATGQAAKLTYERENSNFEASDGLIRFPGRSVGFHNTGSPLTNVELQAPIIQGNMPSKQVRGVGGTTLKTASGLVATTPTAHFDGERSVVSGQERIHAKGTGYEVRADAFVFELEPEKFQFQGAVWSKVGGAR